MNNPIHKLLYIVFGTLALGFTIQWYSASVVGVIGLVVTAIWQRDEEQQWRRNAQEKSQLIDRIHDLERRPTSPTDGSEDRAGGSP